MSKKMVALIVVLVLAVGYFGISWRVAQQDLDSALAELSSTGTVLEGSDKELTEAEDKLLAIKMELQNTKNDLSILEAELEDTRVNLLDVETELEDTNARLAAIQTDAFHLHNPTLEEVFSFLEEDSTDSNEYLDDEYVCSHFASDVNNNAESQGIRCAIVDIRFPSSAHAIVAFDTIDEGLAYFDPISDERVRPVIGRQYWRCIEPKPGYIYEKPPFDDTIEDIVVIW
jgi:hypothetical protein